MFSQRKESCRDCLHDALVFFGVFVPIINIGNSALTVVLNSIHSFAAEAKAGDRSAVGPAQIVRSASGHCCAIVAQQITDVAHRGVESRWLPKDEAGVITGSAELGNDLLDTLR
jgi:hypothetical protein